MGPLYSAGRFLARVVGFTTGWEVRGRENVPRSGGVIVASNHISYWDPPLVGAAVRREAHFLAKEELFEHGFVGPLIAAVNSLPIRRGAADLSGLTRAIEVLKRGSVLVMFPEGSRMRDGELHPARPGVGLLAVQADVPIVPCCISGSNRPRRWLTRRSRVCIWLGPPRHWLELAGPESESTPGRALYRRLGEAVMREIAALRSGQQESASRGAA